MTNTIGAAQIELGVNADGVDAGVNKARRSIESLGPAGKKAGKEASDGIGDIGKVGSQSADKLDAATKRTIASIERQTLAMGKSKAEYYAAQAAINGNSAALAPYIQKMKEAEAANAKSASSMSSFSKAALAAGAAVAAGVFTNMIKGAIDAADNMNDLSKTTSLTVEQLYGLKLAATQSGTNLDGVAKAVSKLSVNMGKNAKDFAAIGISAKDPLEALKQLSDVFVSIEDPQKRAAFAAKALGKSWEEVAPLLSEGGDAIGEMIEKGKGLAGATQDMADQADQFNDAIAELNAGIGGFVSSQAAGLLPLLNVVMEGLNDTASGASNLEGSFSPLTETMRTLVVVGGNVAFVLKGVGNEIGGITAQMAALATGDFKGAFAIGDMMKADAEKARASFDAWEKKAVEAGTVVKTAADKQAEAIAKLDAKYFAGAISAEKYASGIAKLTGQQQAASAGSNKAIDNFVREEKAQKGAVDAGIKYLETLEKETKALTLNESQKRMIAAADAAQKTSNVALRKEIMATALAYEYKTQAIQDAIDAEKMQNGQTDAYIALLNQREMAESDALKTLEDKVIAVEEDTFALTANAEEIKNHNIQLALQKSGLDATSDAFIEYKKRLGDAYSNQSVAKAAKDAQDEWKKSSDEINRSLTDALMRGFESGKGFGQNLVDTIKNMFNTMVLRPIISAIVSPVSGMVSSAMGSLGFAGQASAGTDYLGMASNGITMNSMYNMATGAGQNALSYGAFGTSAANVTGGNMVMTGSAQEMMLAEQGMGGYTAVSPAGGMAAYGGAALGAYYGYQQHGIGGAAAYGAAGYVGGAALSGGIAAAGGGVAAAGSGAMAGASAALAAVPVWGWIALAAIAILGWDAVGETRSGGSYAMGEGFDRNTQDYGSFDTSASTFTSGPSGGEVEGTKDLVDYTIGGINSLLGTLGSTSTLSGFQAGMESSDKDRGGVYSGGTLSDGTRFGETGEGNNYSGGVYENNSAKSGDAAAMGKLFTEDLMQVTIQALQAATDLPKNVMQFLSTIDAESLSMEHAQGVLATVQMMAAQLNEVSFSAWDGLTAGAIAAQAAWEKAGGTGQASTANMLEQIAVLDMSTEAGRDAAFELMNAAASAEQFGRDAAAAMGITAASLSQAFLSAAQSAATAEEAGEMLAQSVVDGIYNSLIGAYAQQIGQIINDGIVGPMLTALLAGQTVSEAVSQQAIDAIVAKAQATATAMNAVFSDARFTDAMDQISKSVASVGRVAYNPIYDNSALRQRAAEEATRREIELERERQRAAEEAERQHQAWIEETTRAINDRYADELRALEDVKNSLEDMLQISQSLADYVNSLKTSELSPLTMGQQLAVAAGDYATLLAQAKAGDLTAAGNLPEASGEYLDLARQFYASSAQYTDIFNSVSDSLSKLSIDYGLSYEEKMLQINQQIADLQQKNIDEVAALGGITSGVGDYIGGAISSGFSAMISTSTGDWQGLAYRIDYGTNTNNQLMAKLTDSTTGGFASLIDVNGDGLLNVADIMSGGFNSMNMSNATGFMMVADAIKNSGLDQTTQDTLLMQMLSGMDVAGITSSLDSLATNDYAALLSLVKTYTLAKIPVSSSYSEQDVTDVIYYAQLYGISSKELADSVGSTYGVNQDDLINWAITHGLPAFAAGGYYEGGMALVGEQGPELINFSVPGQIHTASDTRSMLSGGVSRADIDRLVHAVNQAAEFISRASESSRQAVKEQTGVLVEATETLGRAITDTATAGALK